MKVIKAEIANYRSIKSVVIEFDPACRVLVGINESGKSNILKALAFLGSDQKPNRQDDVRESLPEEMEITNAHVRFYCRFEKAEADILYARACKKIIAGEAGAFLGVEGRKNLNLKEFCEAYHNNIRFHVDLIKEEKGFRYITPDGVSLSGNWRKPSAACPKDFVVEFNGEVVALKDVGLLPHGLSVDIDSAYLEPANAEDISRLIGKLAVEVARENPVESLFWQYDERNLLPASISLTDFASNPEICTPLMNMFWLAGIDDIGLEIARIMQLSSNQIQNFLNRVAAKTTAHFRSVWEEYKDIVFELRLDSENIVPAIREKNGFDFAKRSDGFKRFVTFLLMVSINVKTGVLDNTLLLIDEPDSGLHPSGARYLRDELIRISANNYVVYSTHSIFMIDVGDISRHYIVKKKNEITSIEAARESNVADEEVLFNALGYSIFETLKEKNIIFEGWKDKKLFIEAVNKGPASTRNAFKNIGICHAKGAKHIKSITPMIELAKRSCLIISDSDAPAREQQKLFRAEKGFGDWKTYQDVDGKLEAVTGEDFVKNAFIAKQVSEVAGKLGLASFEAGTLPAHREKLKAIDAWFKEQGLNSDQTKDAAREVKDLIFDRLTAKNIEDNYSILLKGIADSLGLQI